MRLAEISPDLELVGLEPNLVCTVVAVTPLTADAARVVYRLPDGSLKERLLSLDDEAALSVATSERPWAFDGDAATFQLVCEAKRMSLAFAFDPMMAVHTSNVDPLPHQITAVYETMLPRRPLRFLLADDPGAGKTIMAGLYIRELILRADAQRVLIVAPGSLVEQWQEELQSKFELDFRIYSPDMEASAPTGNPFEDYHQLIVRLDQVARRDDLQAKLAADPWDLIIFDEAHKLAAHFFGQQVQETKRFKLAKTLSRRTRHLLLMTATPHNGKEEDFQLFLSLLDDDRFYGKFRDGAHKADVADIMRRMVKEELVKFDGAPLFPERRAYTVNYALSDDEAALYEAVTRYVVEEMNKADQLEGRRRGSVGFALTALQRRLASSPEAIYQSLRRRRERLQGRLQEEKGLRRDAATRRSGRLGVAGEVSLPEDDDDLSARQQEELEEKLVEESTAAQTIAELEAETRALSALEEQARAVWASGRDRKWEELSSLLQSAPEMRDETGRQRKLIVFTEHRDTLNYLCHRITGLLGGSAAVVAIHGGARRDERFEAQARFRHDPDARVLVATDAAGEGVNLQCAHLMINYDLPWNPNRLEQRFGRIHRIGQTEACHLWNLVAGETREGAVWHRLLEKLAGERDALQGKVFDILGDVFEEQSLKSLIVEAIRCGDRPDARAGIFERVEHAFDREHLAALLDRNALARETMTPERLFAVKEEMDKAEARKLQPYFVQRFFLKAFETLGGSIHRREAGRWEITHTPQTIRERSRRLKSRNRREPEPVVKKYERICFSRDAILPAEKPGLSRATLMHPGHPLMLTMIDMILEDHANLLRRGVVLADPSDAATTPWLLFVVTHDVKTADGATLSRRMPFIRVNPDGSFAFAGWAPHLDLEPAAGAAAADILTKFFPRAATGRFGETAALQAAAKPAIEHYQEVAARHIAQIDKTLDAVHKRLTSEIKYQTDRELKLREDRKAGKDVSLPLENAQRLLRDLDQRLEARRKQLLAAREVQNSAPVIAGCALVAPSRLLRGEDLPDASAAAARRRIERLAMQAVIADQQAKGCRVADVSAEKCGWDITSYPPDGGDPKRIEVKGRVKGADTITVTHNEILYALNQGDKFVLAVVFVNPDDSVEAPRYIRRPFRKEPDWGAASVTYDLKALLAQRPGDAA